MSSTQNKHVLIAEDIPGLARVVQFNLKQAGFDVTVARNGLEAWEFAQVQLFDIVLTDQQMPELNGTELCGRLRGLSQYADVPIILLSAKGLEMDAQQLKDTLGIVAVLPKPFSPTALIEVVESTLSSTA